MIVSLLNINFINILLKIINPFSLTVEGVEINGHGKLLAMAYEAVPFLLILLTFLTIIVLVTRIVSLFMHRRGERYRQALLASKNSIIYQKLSEEISAPTTPKLHRYAPINQV